MAENNLRLRVILDMVDRVVAPLKRVTSGSGEAARALKAARDRLKELNQQQNQVSEFRALKQGLQDTTTRLGEAQARVQQLARSYSQAGPPTKAMAREMKSAQREAAALGQQHTTQQAQLQQLRSRLSAAGISTQQLGQHSRTLRSDIAATTAAIAQQTERLKQNAEQHRRIKALNDKHAKAMLHTGMAAGAGAAAMAAGRRGVQVGMGPVGDFATHENHMLGIARQVQGARNDAGQLTNVYRTAEREIRELGRVVPMATTEIADMVTAAARMEVPTDQLKEFTLMASEMATAFDAVPDTITESMGKVAKNFKIPLTDIRGLADSINYLDDNAISKGADIIDFLNRTSGVVSTVAMSARDAAALGSTLLTLGERTETAGTAANAIVQKFAAATKGTKKFRSAMDEIGLSTQAVQDGMSKDATATLMKVIESIRKLPESQRIGVMVELVGMEHSDTLAKLVDKPEELRRQLALANGSEAQGSMAREAAARNATLSAQWRMTQNRMFDLRAVIGESLVPVLAELTRVVNPVLEGLFNWVKAHPVLVKWILGSVVAVSALIAVLGAIALPLALVAGKFLLLRFLLARVGMAMGITRAAAAATAGRVGLLARAWAWVGQAVASVGPWLLRASQWLSAWFATLGTYLPAVLRVAAVVLRFVTGPVGLLILAGTMLYSRWADVVGGFKLLMADLGAAFMGGLQWVANLATAFYDAGANVLQGLVDGMMSRLAAVRDAIGGIADSVAAWFRERLGIASPSKLFMQYGGWISEGAAIGITGGQDGVRRAAMGVATAATMAMPMAAGAAGLQIDGRPPLTAQAMAGAGGGAGGSSYQITIHAAPGMDEQALARAVSAELDRRERAKRSRVLSTFGDID